MNTHEALVTSIQNQLRQCYQEQTAVKFIRASTNSTRHGTTNTGTRTILITDLQHILDINPEQKYIDVEPGVPMDKLVESTLSHYLIPPVVPEFPGITVGGAIQGGALESSSFRFGQFNDTALEYEILLFDGTLVIATPTNEFSDLFWGMSTSYGTLGLLTRVRLSLISALSHVDIQAKIFATCDDFSTSLVEATATPKNDFVEGIVLSQQMYVLLVGSMVKTPTQHIRRFSRNIDPWYWHFIAQQNNEGQFSFSTPIVDYLFRYDRGAFWMGDHLFPIFGLKSTRLTRCLFSPFIHTRKLYDGLHELGIEQDYIIQDIYLDPSRFKQALGVIENRTHIYPLWVCPIQSSTQPQYLSSHYRTHTTMVYNLGIYGKSTHDSVLLTQEIEKTVLVPGVNRKMLYAESYFPREVFWEHYDKTKYLQLRTKYKAQHTPSIDDKVLSSLSSPTKINKVKAFAKLIKESLIGKNVTWW